MNKKANIHWIQTQINSLKQAKTAILSSYDIIIGEEEETRYKTIITELNKLINDKVNELEYIEKRNNYQYSFRYQEHGQAHIVKTRFVINPNLTKEYKQLKHNFEHGYIHSFEWELIK